MSQQLKEFVKQSGVELRPSATASSVASYNSNNNNNFARELEANMLKRQEFPNRLEKNMMSNANYNEFSDAVDSNWNSNANYNKLPNENKKMINNVLREFEPPIPAPSTNIAGRFPVTQPLQLAFSKLNPGMFNATVNKEFPQQGDLIDLKKILMKVPQPRTSIGEGLYLDTTQIIGRFGAMREGFSHTREYGKQGDIKKNFFTVQIKVTISNGTEAKGGTVNIYKNGKIRFSGGFIGTNIANQPELIRRYIVNTYTEKEAYLYNPFEYNNLSGQFRFNGKFKALSSITDKARMYASSGVTKLSYEPELSPFMYVNYKGHKYNFTESGNIQISGSPSPADMLVAYNDAIALIKLMNTNGDVEITGQVPKELTKGAPKKRGPKKKIGPRTPVKKTKTEPKKKRNSVFNIQINGIQCMRFSKEQLTDLAKKLGVVGITKSTKKEDLCKKINAVVNKNSATIKNKGKNVKLSGANKDFKLGKTKCKTYGTKDDLIRVAKIMKIDIAPKETKDTLCKKIEKARNMMIAPKPKPPTPPPKKVVRQQKAQEKKNIKATQVMTKRGMNDASIRKDLIKFYGKRWMDRYKPSLNNDVREVRSRIAMMSRGNKTGIPFKKNVDDVKKSLVSKWKRERVRNLEKKYVMNSLNTGGIPRPFVNAYKAAATKYVLIHSPTKTQLAKYKKSWLSNAMNTKNASPKPVYQVKAKRETL
jgi:hypothetical protein